ncbi:hypothetical protein [Streptosporangium subroseum]|uniref:hypothetical protein n=1 Tax=Streptosporangium subroseum TaxID=106412 RepID=UPI003085D23E|nr:hypothetical protein OHB15_04650 [Streptosporangium subroseum]
MDLLTGLEPAGEQLRHPLLQHGDPGVTLAQGVRDPVQRLVHTLRVIADDAYRDLKGHEVDGAELPGGGQVKRRHVRGELGKLTSPAHGDHRDTGDDGYGSENEYDQHIRIVPQLL